MLDVTFASQPGACVWVRGGDSVLMDSVLMPSITTPFVPRDNLNQWEKVIRGEETAMWISGPAASKSTSEKLNVRVDD